MFVPIYFGCILNSLPPSVLFPVWNTFRDAKCAWFAISPSDMRRRRGIHVSKNITQPEEKKELPIPRNAAEWQYRIENASDKTALHYGNANESMSDGPRGASAKTKTWRPIHAFPLMVNLKISIAVTITIWIKMWLCLSLYLSGELCVCVCISCMCKMESQHNFETLAECWWEFGRRHAK